METNTNAEIQGAKAASRNLSSKLYKLDQESLKQQEIVYNQVLNFHKTSYNNDRHSFKLYT